MDKLILLKTLVGQHLVPFLLRNRRHVRYIISSLNVTMMYRREIEAYLADGTDE